MRIIEIFLIAAALAADALAVSIASGVQLKKIRLRQAVLIAFFFGFFQFMMPLLGAVAGVGIKKFVSAIDHWVIFVILSFVGVKMIYEAFIIKKEEKKFNPLHLKTLLLFATATSMDAFAVGISLSLFAGSIFLDVTIIGIVTFTLCLAGVFIGSLIGHFFEEKIEAIGGLILIGIGVKILMS